MAKAMSHFERATSIAPSDQLSWIGLAQTCEELGDIPRADEAYGRTIELDEFSEIAAIAKAGRSRLAQASFRSAAPATERMDAVMYCLGAIERFEAMSTGEVQAVALEVARLGASGINPNDPRKTYRLTTLHGTFTGLHLLCLMHVAFQRIDATVDIGFDLSREYATALELHRGG